MIGMEEDESCPKEKEQSITFLQVKIEKKKYDIDKINDLVRKSVEIMQFWKLWKKKQTRDRKSITTAELSYA